MKKLFAIYCVMAAVGCLCSCSNESSSNFQGTVTVSFELSGTSEYESVFASEYWFTDSYYTFDSYIYFSAGVLSSYTSYFGGIALCTGSDSESYTSGSCPYTYKVYGDEGGHSGSDCYGVYWDSNSEELMPDYPMWMTWYYFSGSGTGLPVGMYVNNTCTLVNQALNGMGLDSAASSTDWVLLTVKGYDSKDNLIGSASMYLVEDGVPITEWTYFELDSVGYSAAFDFEITSSRDDFQKAVCFDDLTMYVSGSS